MHHIQAKILRKMLYGDGFSYAALRPDGVESNHFAYHLEQLLRQKFICKDDRFYTLTPAGLAYVDRMSQRKMTDRLQPHIVTAIDLTTPDGRTLLFRRNFQPYLHLIGFPLGKLHYDESIAEAAARELAEKTGLTNIALTHRGMTYIQADKEGTTIGRVLYHVFHGDVPEPLATATPLDRGECYWADHQTLQPAECMPGFLRVKELLGQQDGLFFDEIHAEL